MLSFLIPAPTEFDFDHCLSFLRRSPQEVLHRYYDSGVRKLIVVNGSPVLFQLEATGDQSLKVDILNRKKVSSSERQQVESYIREWFDLDKDLSPFYSLALKDKMLQPLAEKFYGYRIVGQPDLFESLVWAVIGQQINLSFAYKLKQRFVESFGEWIEHAGQRFYLFPTPDVVAKVNRDQLLSMQFSRQKANYTMGIAEAFVSGNISKEKLQGLTLSAAKETLMKTKGIGNWTANYALMKTFRYSDAFPLEDAGLHNAIKKLKKLDAKPSLEKVKKIFRRYKGWEAYATLYLWKSL